MLLNDFRILIRRKEIWLTDPDHQEERTAVYMKPKKYVSTQVSAQ